MKDIKRSCDNCKNETETYMKVLILNSNHQVISSRSYDLCKDCVLNRFPEFNNKKRAGLEK